MSTTTQPTAPLKKPHYMVQAKLLGIDGKIIKEHATDLGFYYRKIGGHHGKSFIQDVLNTAKLKGWRKLDGIIVSPCMKFKLITECNMFTEAKQNRFILNIVKA